MAKHKWYKKSIVSFFTIQTIAIILIQTLLLAGMTVFGGVFKRAELNSYESFNEKVNNRCDYIQQEMKNNWTNLSPHLSDLRKNISKIGVSDVELLHSASENVVQILSSTGVTGAYIILGEVEGLDNRYSALYLRDYEPLTNSYKNNDIHMVYGPPEVASEYKFPLDSTWQYNLHLTKENENFYKKPFQNSNETINPHFLGYWSEPFKLTPEDISIVTYSMPLENLNGEIIGVLGIELATNYLAKFLPASDLRTKDSLGYIIAKKQPRDKKFYSMITTNNLQKRVIDETQPIEFKQINKEHNIQFFLNNKTKDDIYASAVKVDLYPHASPFQDVEWYIVGFMQSDYLLSYVNQIYGVIKTLFIISLIIGVILGIVISKKMAKPVTELISQVTEADKTSHLLLEPTGFSELDELSSAIMQTNKLMINSASRFSRIIEMVDLPIGTFEINKYSEFVLITEKTPDILGWENADIKVLKYKNVFLNMISNIMSNPEPEEENVYKLTSIEDRWVKIKINESEDATYGIVQDVSEEIVEKIKIKLERDLDPLTKILNRASFQARYEQWYAERSEKVAALLMFDLDSLKLMNDTYGHKWGDIYIIGAANQLKHLADSNNLILARRSGDEFVALLYDFESKDQIRKQLVDFYKHLNNYKLEFPDGKYYPIKISSGFAWVEEPYASYDEILNQADEALYYSKQHKKGHFTESTVSLENL